MDTHTAKTVKEMILFARPNYYTFLMKQKSTKLTQVYDNLHWRLSSYPLCYHHYYYNFIGVYFAVNGYDSKAEEFLVEADRVRPDSEVTLSNLVILMCDGEQYEDAAHYMNRLSKIRKNLPTVNIDLAILFQLFNLTVAARQLFEAVIATKTKIDDFIMFQYAQVLLHHSIGRMFYDNILDRAIRIFVGVNKQNPDFLPNTLSLISALNLKWRFSQKDDAIIHPHSEILEQKIYREQFTHDSHSLYILGKVLKKVNKFDEAKDFFVKSVEIWPMVDNNYDLGKCHQKLMELGAAEECFKAAQKLSPVFNPKILLKEATALVAIGRRLDSLRLVNGCVHVGTELDKHDKVTLQLFIAENNIMSVPEVSRTLNSSLNLMYKSFSKKMYARFIKVVKLFTEHLSSYYATTGMPSSQLELLLKWAKFLQDRGEITEEKFTELTKVDDLLILQKHPSYSAITKRISMARGPLSAMSRRRSTVRPSSSLHIQRSEPQMVPSSRSLASSPDFAVPEHPSSCPATTQRLRRKSVIGHSVIRSARDSPTSKRHLFSVPIQDQISEEREGS